MANENTIKYTELFYSLQGEGRKTGTPSVFLRVFGCNLTCPGFGGGRVKNDYAEIDIDNIGDIHDLPIVEYGCDSYASWHPKFKKYAKEDTIENITDRIIEFGTQDLVITGGEPLLKGMQYKWVNLLGNIITAGEVFRITFETNGTIELTPELRNMIIIYSRWGGEVIFSLSPKLSKSGEPYEKRINYKAIRDYYTFAALHPSTFDFYLKFVVDGSDDSIEEVVGILNELDVEYGLTIEYSDDVYLMPEGATLEQINEIQTKVADQALKYGFSFSTRLHNMLWGNKWGT